MKNKEFEIGATYRVVNWKNFILPSEYNETYVANQINRSGTPLFTVDSISEEGYAMSKGCIVSSKQELRTGVVVLHESAENNPEKELKAAYATLAADFKDRVNPGSIVRVAKKWTDEDAKRWGVTPPGIVFDTIDVGHTFKVNEVDFNGNVMDYEPLLTFPFICLEVVEYAPKPTMVRRGSFVKGKRKRSNSSKYDSYVVAEVFDKLLLVNRNTGNANSNRWCDSNKDGVDLIELTGNEFFDNFELEKY